MIGRLQNEELSKDLKWFLQSHHPHPHPRGWCSRDERWTKMAMVVRLVLIVYTFSSMRKFVFSLSPSIRLYLAVNRLIEAFIMWPPSRVSWEANNRKIVVSRENCEGRKIWEEYVLSRLDFTLSERKMGRIISFWSFLREEVLRVSEASTKQIIDARDCLRSIYPGDVNGDLMRRIHIKLSSQGHISDVLSILWKGGAVMNINGFRTMS